MTSAEVQQLGGMDIKEEGNSVSEGNLSTNDFVNASVCHIDIKTEIKEEARDQRELFSEPYVMKLNKSSDSEIETKTEIKEEEWWIEGTSTQTPSIYNDINDETAEHLQSIKSPGLNKVGVSSDTSDFFSNEDIANDRSFIKRKDSAECQIEKGDADRSSTETPDSGNIVSMTLHLKQNKLLQHNNANGQEVNKCDVCHKGFTQLQNLKRHKLIHEGIKPHRCNICNKAFTQLQHLKTHRLIHDGIKPHKCNICIKSFTQLQHLKKHKLVHEGVKPQKCNICNKSFSDLWGLKIHKLIHDGIRPHKCDICNKGFADFSGLKRHKFIHEGIKAHKCNICKKAFTELSGLKKHKLIHDGIKPHKCNVCNKAFTHLSDLKRHKLIHKNIKPH